MTTITPTSLKKNCAAGVVVFLIALPLCLGIALASGAPPLAGVISGVIGGIVVGLLSTSNISVAGPAAGLTTIILAAITQLGSFELFLCAGIIAGALQLILGYLRAGSFAEYIPVAVIEGMLAAIGIIIILQQLPVIFWQADTVWHVTHWITNIHLGATLITVVSILILLAWHHVPIVGKIKLLPSALVAVIGGTVLNQLFVLQGSDLAIPTSQLVHLPIPAHLSEFSLLMITPDWNGFLLPHVWITGITMAVVASIETLLCIEATDRLDIYRRITDTNHELRAQGIGNMVSGLVGGLPITSVIVRSSANVTAGATDKTSTITHGILMLICAITIPALLDKIPLATLAVVLIFVGYNLAKPTKFVRFYKKGRYQFIPFVATIIAVVSLGLLDGVGVGLVISIIFILQKNMKHAYYLSQEQLEGSDEIEIKLAEEVSFLNKAAIKKTLKNIQANSTVRIDANDSNYIAQDVLELIEDFVNYTAVEKNINVRLHGFKHSYSDENETTKRVFIRHHQSI